MAAVVLLVASGLLWAQVSASGNQSARAADEVVGIRFTPGMAKAIANKLRPLLKHEEVPDDKQDEAVEKISRRLMEAAHAMDGRGQEFIGRFMEMQIARQMDGGSGGGGFMAPEFSKEFADRVLELTPAMKNFMRGFAQDIRPMMPMKQQIKFAGEMMAAKTAIDAFEETMKKWSSGDTEGLDNPFMRERKVEKDETGQSKELQTALKSSQEHLDRFAISDWDRYAKNFKKFYGLSEAQCSTVDSILREFKQRAEQRKRDTAWRDRYYRNQTWINIFWRVPRGWNHPVLTMIKDDQEEACSWVEALSMEFKSRLDAVPTGSQRKKADARIEAALEEKGIIVEGGDK
jgi:hypothetical protein